MDPNDPFFHQNFQPNFMDTHTSFSPYIQINSSQFPESSTQFSDAQNQPAKSREIRTRWTSTEDMVLISAWLNTGKDPVVGNEQKAGAFWKRVVSYYAASEDVAGFSPRGTTRCSQRWKKIGSECNKFVGCCSQASAMRGKGQSEDDVFQIAIQLYFER
ncbi:Glutathione S-transferase T3 [Cardamine amara subsp. amara]|uniref:Glutathione S-transferase T3 n=1 Tax=Cardamine amara subsp. amara TaxID=228776 RepID=A0ABD1BCI3_CARAN